MFLSWKDEGLAEGPSNGNAHDRRRPEIRNDDAAPDARCPPAAHDPSGNGFSHTGISPEADGFRAFYRLYAERSGKSRWGDKTPEYVLHISDIAETLPEAHFIHIIRDGRDVGLSLRQCWFAPGHHMKGLADHWQQGVIEGRRQGSGCPHYIEVRYETLVSRPSAVLGEICGFLGLPYVSQLERYHERSMDRLREHGDRRTRDGMLVVSREERLRQQQLVSRPPDPSRIEAWKETMTTDERRDFEEVASELLRDLGYEV